MKTFVLIVHLFGFWTFFFSTIATLKADVTVANVHAAQRPGTKIVDIYYDVTASTEIVHVRISVSDNGGRTFDVDQWRVRDAGGVKPGKRMHSSWNAKPEWDNRYSRQMRFLVEVNEDVSGRMVTIPEGTFLMGDPFLRNESALPVLPVNLSEFAIGTTEVTEIQWNEVARWGKANGYGDLVVLTRGGGAGAYEPVINNWYEVVKWCNALSEKEGLSPCYRNHGGGVYRSGYDVPKTNYEASGYRLPTEAEWEKAARGGLAGKRYPWGNERATKEFAYFNYTNRPGTLYEIIPVGSYPANGYGLYDMGGSEREWCNDWFSSAYYQELYQELAIEGEAVVKDPEGPDSLPPWAHPVRAIRGGDWRNGAKWMECGKRWYGNVKVEEIQGRTWYGDVAGFRVVRRGGN